MVHRLHAVGAHRRQDTIATLGVTQQRDQLDAEPFGADDDRQLALQVVERDLGDLEQHQPAWAVAQDLAAELRTDRTARARHHHRLVADAGREQRVVRAHRFTTEEVRDIKLADVLGTGLTGDDLGHVRQRLHMHAEGQQRREDLLTAFAGRRGDREQDTDAFPLAHEGGQTRRRHHRQVVDERALHRTPVVDEGDRPILAAAVQRDRDLPTCGARAEDDQRRGVVVREGVEQVTGQQTRPADEEHRQGGIHHENRPRQRRGGQKEVVVERRNDRGQHDTRHDGVACARPEESDHRVIEPRREERPHRDQERHHRQRDHLHITGEPKIRPERDRTPQRERDQQNIRRRHEHALGPARPARQPTDEVSRPAQPSGVR